MGLDPERSDRWRPLLPSWLGALLFVILIVSQSLYFSTLSGGISSVQGKTVHETRWTLGIAEPIEIVIRDGQRNLDANWLLLTLTIIFFYTLSALLAYGMAWAAASRRPARLYGAAIILMLVATFLVSIGWSRSYWGYYVRRPSVLTEVAKVETVHDVVSLYGEWNNGILSLYPRPGSIASVLPTARKNPRDYETYRFLAELDDRQKLPEEFSATFPSLKEVLNLVLDEPIVRDTYEHDRSLTQLWGVAISAEDHAGDPIILLGLRGPAVSNDHYPYFELVYVTQTDDGPYVCQASQMFYFDVAGIEGQEWWVKWVLLSMPTVCFGPPILAIVILVGRGVNRMFTRKSDPRSLKRRRA